MIEIEQKDNKTRFGIEKLIASFLKKMEVEGKTPATIKTYQVDLGTFKSFLEESRSPLMLDEIRFPHILEYSKYLQNRYHSDNSKRRRVQALRLFFDYLVTIGTYPENPVKKITASPKFVDIPRPAPFIDIRRLWTHLVTQKNETPIFKLTHKRNELLIYMIFTGVLSISELIKIQKTDLILNGTVPKILIKKHKRDPYTIELPPFFRTILTDYLKLFDELSAAHQISGPHLFFNANAHKIVGTGISARGVEIVFKLLSQELKLEITPKNLRQAGIFNLLAKGISEVVIKEWLGVAPSYTLKPYRDLLHENLYSDQFLEEIYLHYLPRNTRS